MAVISSAQIRPDLLDALIDSYVDWREECLALKTAYERWRLGPSSEQKLAFAAYEAALDREEQASVVYAGQVGRIEDELAAKAKRANWPRGGLLSRFRRGQRRVAGVSPGPARRQ